MNNIFLGIVFGSVGTAYFTHEGFKAFADNLSKKLQEYTRKIEKGDNQHG